MLDRSNALADSTLDAAFLHEYERAWRCDDANDTTTMVYQERVRNGHSLLRLEMHATKFGASMDSFALRSTGVCGIVRLVAVECTASPHSINRFLRAPKLTVFAASIRVHTAASLRFRRSWRVRFRLPFLPMALMCRLPYFFAVLLPPIAAISRRRLIEMQAKPRRCFGFSVIVLMPHLGTVAYGWQAQKRGHYDLARVMRICAYGLTCE